MFNIENVKIGDYVETKCGGIGYINRTAIKARSASSGKLFVIAFEWISNSKKYLCKGDNTSLSIFKQIGTYVFDDKDKIKPLKYEDFTIEHIYSNNDIPSYYDGLCLEIIPKSHDKLSLKIISSQEMAKIDKINEIIKWINERG